MKSRKTFSIWAGNFEFELFDRARSFFRALDPRAAIRTHNADAYSGPGDIGTPDLAYVQPRYSRIIADHGTAGIPLINAIDTAEQPNEGSIRGRSEGIAPGGDDLPHPPAEGSAPADEARPVLPEAVPMDNRLADGNQLRQPGRPNKPGRKKAGGKAE